MTYSKLNYRSIIYSHQAPISQACAGFEQLLLTLRNAIKAPLELATSEGGSLAGTAEGRIVITAEFRKKIAFYVNFPTENLWILGEMATLP